MGCSATMVALPTGSSGEGVGKTGISQMGPEGGAARGTGLPWRASACPAAAEMAPHPASSSSGDGSSRVVLGILERRVRRGCSLEGQLRVRGCGVEPRRMAPASAGEATRGICRIVSASSGYSPPAVRARSSSWMLPSTLPKMPMVAKRLSADLESACITAPTRSGGTAGAPETRGACGFSYRTRLRVARGSLPRSGGAPVSIS